MIEGRFMLAELEHAPKIGVRGGVAALIAATVFATQAMAARNDVATRHGTARAHTSATRPPSS